MWGILVTLLLSFGGSNIEVDYASGFAHVDPKTGKRDKWAGGPSPCIYRLVKPTDNLIAHRTLPCGTKVRLTNLRTGKTTVSYVGERGPYGACTYPGWQKWQTKHPYNAAPCPRGYWRVKLRKKDRGVWRGAFDLTPRVRKALEHNGFELVLLEVMPSKRHRPHKLKHLVARR